ncbi:MAG: DUF6197 family protein [Pseudohongiellaceae bacterium]
MPQQLTTADILVGARKLIADPAHWTKHYWAKDKDGKPIDIHDPKAERFCALGAIMRFNRTQNPDFISAVLSADNLDLPEQSAHDELWAAALDGAPDDYDGDQDDKNGLSNWNDTGARKHREVMKAFNAAIRNAKGRK